VRTKKNRMQITDVCDVDGIMTQQRLDQWNLIPSGQFNKLSSVLATAPVTALGARVLYNANQFDHRKKWMSVPGPGRPGNVVKSTPATGPVFLHTTTENPDVKTTVKMFGIPKVILGDSTQGSAFYDTTGKYATAENAMGIEASETDGKSIMNALRSHAFKLYSARYLKFEGGFRLTASTVRWLRKDFYKAFLPGGEIHKLYEEGKLKPPAERQCGYLPSCEITKF